MHPPKMPKQVHTILGLVGYYRKCSKNVVKIAKPLTLLTCQQVKFDWTLTHHDAFLKLKESIIQAPILQYPNPNKKYIVHTNASDYACRAQLSQGHDGTEFLLPFFPIPFWKHKENGAPQNKKLTEFTMQSPSGISISREWML